MEKTISSGMLGVDGLKKAFSTVFTFWDIGFSDLNLCSLKV